MSTIRALLDSHRYTVDVYLVDYNKMQGNQLENTCVACVANPDFNRDKVSQELLLNLSKFVSENKVGYNNFTLKEKASTSSSEAVRLSLPDHVNILNTHRVNPGALEFYRLKTLNISGQTMAVGTFKAMSYFVEQLAGRARCLDSSEESKRHRAQVSLQETVEQLRLESLADIKYFSAEGSDIPVGVNCEKEYHLKINLNLFYSPKDIIFEFVLPESMLNHFSLVDRFNMEMAENIGLLSAAYPESMSVVNAERNLRQKTLAQLHVM